LNVEQHELDLLAANDRERLVPIVGGATLVFALQRVLYREVESLVVVADQDLRQSFYDLRIMPVL
jgi:hypothetical protein